MPEDFRIEKDSMGEMRVPASALYGAQTQRAVENFPISSFRLPTSLIKALGLIKFAAAEVNGADGAVPHDFALAIQEAAGEIIAGRHDESFVVDIFQTGSGTSSNMNANEVIAHLASKRLGGRQVHPNDDVNHAQSSNDVFPTAIHIAAATTVRNSLLPALAELTAALTDKAREFHDVIKIGRTHLQDAVPMRLGQEFGGYAAQVAKCSERIELTLPGLHELALGGTAVGTGLNAKPGFARAVIEVVSERTGIRFREADNHFEAQAAKDAICFLSGSLRTAATALFKIANDVRWLGSGPRCGLGELRLLETQPGSSIMPGKVNPVIAESLMMVCVQVIGYDAAIGWCAANGNFELNVMMPLMAYDALSSIELLAAGALNFSRKCVTGLQADRARSGAFVEQSLAMVTALVPEIGYDRAAELAKKAYSSGRTVRETALEESGLTAEQLSRLLDPEAQAGG